MGIKSNGDNLNETTSILSMNTLINDIDVLRTVIGTDSFCFFCIDSNGAIEFSDAILDIIDIEKPRLSKFTDFFRFVVPEDIPLLKKLARDISLGSKATASIEFRIKRKNNLPIWVKCSCKHFKNEDEHSRIIIGSIMDITDEKNNAMIISSAFDGTFIHYLENDECRYNGEIFDSLFLKAGYYKDAKRSFINTIIPEDRAAYINYLSEAKETQTASRFEFRVYGKDLQPVWLATRGKYYYDANNEAYVFAGGLTNINEFKVYNEFIKSESQINKTTCLPNRFKLIDDLNDILNDSNSSDGYAIMIDIDDFKNINNTYDYVVGNLFLKEFSCLLKRNNIFSGNIYHYDADVFVLIVKGISKQDAIFQMEHYKTITSLPFTYKKNTYPYSVSIAAVPYNKYGDTPEKILKECSIALQKVKMSGKKNYIMFSNHLYDEYIARVELEMQLRNSVLNGMEGFMIYYQPFISATDNSCLGAEALLRYQTASGEILPPLTFIPVLETLGLMPTVGDWVFRNAAIQCKAWLDCGFNPDFYISINISPSQLESKGFADSIINCVEELGVNPHNIIIEITENVLIMDFQNGMNQLSALREKGIKIAIDDFGTGYSSLSYFRNLPVDEIKIDRSFINDIESDNYSREFVNSIIKITQSINRKICVEGVETIRQSKILKNLKADVLQGFLYSKPIPKDEFEDLFSTYFADRSLQQ